MRTPAQTQEEVVREIVVQERQRIVAYAARDVATLDRLLPEHFTFTRPGGVVLTKAQLLRLIGLGELVYERINRRYDYVNAHLNTAVVIGRDTVVGSYQGRDLSGQYRFCSMYLRAGGGWQVAVTHTHRLSATGAEAV